MKKKEKKAQLPFRLNILFFTVFLLFSILILQLGVVQILSGETYQQEIDKTSQDISKHPVPRGKMFDRNHQLIVDNEPLYAITYTPPKDVQSEEKLDLAKELVKFISMDIFDEEGNITGISERNKQEYWYLNNRDEAENRLSEEDREDLDTGEQYTAVLKKITDKELDELSDEDLEIIAIKKELDKAHSLTPQIIKNENVTLEEYSTVAEHLDQLSGINVTTDWNRTYPINSTIQAFLGSITSQSQGILAEREQYYLTRGYSRNDRVGRSGLEDQYEELLKGRKEQIEYITNKNGQIVDSNVIIDGARGKDLVLTFDQEYQEMVDKVIQREMKKAIKEHPNNRKTLEDALAVVLNPKTGEILAASGQHYNKEKNEFENAAIKTLYDAHRPGSVVKGATVLAGLQSGVITPNQVFVDRPIKIADTPNLGSWKVLGPVNDIDALERSSNVYMAHIAMRMGGEFNYQENQRVSYDPDGFEKMRNYYYQFGLGTETGIDFPYEETGYRGVPPSGGVFQHYAIGQFETYTTLQLAQYVSTIANDGYRVRPHFVKEVREPNIYKDELGPVYRNMNTEVLNRIEMEQTYIERVQEGFRRAFQSNQGTAGSYFSDRDYNPAGKTGTAEDSFWENGVEIEVENLALIGYAPFDDPEVAFAIIVPHLDNKNDYPINNRIGQGILDSYFELKEKRAKE